MAFYKSKINNSEWGNNQHRILKWKTIIEIGHRCSSASLSIKQHNLLRADIFCHKDLIKAVFPRNDDFTASSLNCHFCNIFLLGTCARRIFSFAFTLQHQTRLTKLLNDFAWEMQFSFSIFLFVIFFPLTLFWHIRRVYPTFDHIVK